MNISHYSEWTHKNPLPTARNVIHELQCEGRSYAATVLLAYFPVMMGSDERLHAFRTDRDVHRQGIEVNPNPASFQKVELFPSPHVKLSLENIHRDRRLDLYD